MKIVYAFALIMLALGSCEEIVYEEVIRYVDRPVPAPFVQTSKTEECVSTDTTKVEILIKDITENGQLDKDTVLSVTTACHMKITIKGKVAVPHKTVEIHDSIPYAVHDSIPYPVYVEVPGPTPPPQIVYKDTTIIEQRVVYLSTEYVMIYMRNVTFIPEAIQPHVNEFYGLASQYGKLTIGGHMIIQYTDDLPGEGWVSHSYWVGGPASIDNPYAQMVIEISESLPPELHRASILRELGRLQLKRKYTVVPDRLMNPLFPPGQAITQNHLNDLFALPI